MVIRAISNLLGFGGNHRNRLLMDGLHAQIVAAVRQVPFYAEYGVADTFDGRFELFCLLGTLVLRRLERLPAPGPDVAQDLTDAVVRHLDIILRQEGIGDVAVPKRIKKYAKAFAGRNAAYAAALDQGDDAALEKSLLRNLAGVYGPEFVARFETQRMVLYIKATQLAFETADLAIFTDGQVPFPDAAQVV